jgi:hypothetical protein
MQCPLCGVERDAPAVGPHECNPHRVRERERESAAAYCLDRADQYPTKSPIWVALADAAEGIAKGEAWESMRAGETEDLLKRVRTLSGVKRPTPRPKVQNRTPLTREKIG